VRGNIPPVNKLDKKFTMMCLATAKTTKILILIISQYLNCVKVSPKSSQGRLRVRGRRAMEVITPGDHTFFLGKNRFGNMSCVSNMFFLKKNENFLSRKNLIKMNYFIHIFLLWKMVYFTEKKICEK